MYCFDELRHPILIQSKVAAYWCFHLQSYIFCLFQVDPTLIGGMVVDIGDKYVDMSMATKIKTYTNAVKQAV